MKPLSRPGKGSKRIRAGLFQLGCLGGWNWLFRENPEVILFRKQEAVPRVYWGALSASRDPVHGLPARGAHRSRGAPRFATPFPYLPRTAGDPEAILCGGPRVAWGPGVPRVAAVCARLRLASASSAPTQFPGAPRIHPARPDR